MNQYIVIVICNNEIYFINSFSFLVQAEMKAIGLANEWYKKEGIQKYGLNRIRTIDEMNDYYSSMAYFNSGDSTHVVIEDVIAAI